MQGIWSQQLMDWMGGAVAQACAPVMETVMYHARAAAAAAPVHHKVPAYFRQYSLRALSTGALLLTDQECLIPTALVMWGDPTEDDDITRADGTLWKVIGPVRGGRMRPFFVLQTRQVG